MNKCNFCSEKATVSLFIFNNGVTEDVYFCDYHLEHYKAERSTFEVSNEKDICLKEQQYYNENEFTAYLQPCKKTEIIDVPCEIIKDEDKDEMTLKKELKEAVKNENYIRAAKLRDTIRREKKNVS